MLNKIYGWIETSFANLRNDEPAAEDSDGYPAPREALVRRKRPIEWYENVRQRVLKCMLKYTIPCDFTKITTVFCSSLEDGHNIHQDDLAIKKSRMGTCIFTLTYRYIIEQSTHSCLLGFCFFIH